MTPSERLIELLSDIESETAAFYESLARRFGEPRALAVIWRALAAEERQHPRWIDRLRGSLLAEGVLASAPAPPLAPLSAALQEIRRHRERLEGGSRSSVDALAAAIAIETSEASRALADFTAAIAPDRDAGPPRPAASHRLTQLALAAELLGATDLAATVRAAAPRMAFHLASRPTVLIVDNDLDMLETCARILRGSGYDCLTASRGREGLERLRSRPLDLVVAELRMPEVNGLTLLAGARRLAPGVPVVIVTAYGSSDAVRQAREAGADGYLAKPFSVSQLREVVANLFVGRPLAGRPDPEPPGPSGANAS